MINDLYNLIGERRTISAATAAFYKRVMADESLRPFFEGADMEQLHSRQSMFLSMLLGGRVVYTGKDIAAAHAKVREQGLNSTHFDKFLAHFREALGEVGVEADKVEQVIKLLEQKRGTIFGH
jgi:hemoglobin